MFFIFPAQIGPLLRQQREGVLSKAVQEKARFELGWSANVACTRAIRQVDWDMDTIKSLLGEMNPKLLNYSLGRTKCGQTIRNILGKYFAQLLMEKMKNRPFSLLLDECTDVSVQKRLGAVVRFPDYEAEVIRTMYLGIHQVESGSGRHLYEGQ